VARGTCCSSRCTWNTWWCAKKCAANSSSAPAGAARRHTNDAMRARREEAGGSAVSTPSPYDATHTRTLPLYSAVHAAPPNPVPVLRGFVSLSHAHVEGGSTLSHKCMTMEGKVALVTGANTGIGLETARCVTQCSSLLHLTLLATDPVECGRRGLYRMGAHVVLACRSKSSAEKAMESIKASVVRHLWRQGRQDLPCLGPIVCSVLRRWAPFASIPSSPDHA